VSFQDQADYIDELINAHLDPVGEMRRVAKDQLQRLRDIHNEEISAEAAKAYKQAVDKTESMLRNQIEDAKEAALIANGENVPADTCENEKLVLSEGSGVAAKPDTRWLRQNALDYAVRVGGTGSVVLANAKLFLSFLDAETHSDTTMTLLHNAIVAETGDADLATDLINALQNAGILFRERADAE